jgi:hypothetical protein
MPAKKDPLSPAQPRISPEMMKDLMAGFEAARALFIGNTLRAAGAEAAV